MAGRDSSTPRFAYKGDRLKPLRAFCQTARLGSVSRAAEALYLTQPAVTLQLQALERELGVRLLERSPEGSCSVMVFSGRVGGLVVLSGPVRRETNSGDGSAGSRGSWTR